MGVQSKYDVFAALCWDVTGVVYLTSSKRRVWVSDFRIGLEKARLIPQLLPSTTTDPKLELQVRVYVDKAPGHSDGICNVSLHL